MSISVEVRLGAVLPKRLHLWLCHFLSYWGQSSEPKLWDKQWQNESRTVKWTPSLWPEDRKLLTWDTSCTCLLLSSLCWNSRHCQLHCHCVDEGTKCKLHYCVQMFTLLTAAITWLIHWEHTRFIASLIQLSTDISSEIKHKYDSAFRPMPSWWQIWGILWRYYTKLYSLNDEHIEVTQSHLLEMHQYEISRQITITHNYPFVVHLYYQYNWCGSIWINIQFLLRALLTTK